MPMRLHRECRCEVVSVGKPLIASPDFVCVQCHSSGGIQLDGLLYDFQQGVQDSTGTVRETETQRVYHANRPNNMTSTESCHGLPLLLQFRERKGNWFRSQGLPDSRFSVAACLEPPEAGGSG